MLAVYTAADLEAAGIEALPSFTRPPPFDLKGADGSPMADGSQYPLARERVRYGGEPVALIVAESVAAAWDAAELIEVDYRPLPAVVAAEDALKDDYARITYQGDYVRELIAETDYPSFDVAAADQAFFQWKKHKKQDIMGFRDNGYVSPMTGTMAPPHHTRWVEALDDSLKSYLQLSSHEFPPHAQAQAAPRLIPPGPSG